MSTPKTRAKARPAASTTVPQTPVPAFDSRLEEILREQPSPFSDAVLPNAFRETPDVPTIHRGARERCMSLINEARLSGRTALQVILGDAGEGKTHLIAHLRRQSEDGWRKDTATKRFALTVIPPLRSLARARHHVLQEVVRQLSTRLPGNIHVDPATDTPIEILVWRALLAIAKSIVAHKGTNRELRGALEDLPLERVDTFLGSCVDQLRDAWKLIGRAFVDTALSLPELAAVDREVFRVVAKFPEGDEPERCAIVDWLGGGSLGTERLEALGTSLVLDEEAGAARGLKTLLALAQFAGTPVALAFDQIEGTDRLGPDALAEFFGTLTEIYNEAPGTVLLVFCQTQLWPKLREQAPNHVRDRLDDSPALHLKAITPEEAFLLVETRMKHFWDGIPNGSKDPLYPLTRHRIVLDVERNGLRTPRAVVRHFQALLRAEPEHRGEFQAPAPPEPTDLVRRKLDTLLDEETRTTRPPDSRSQLVQSVVGDLLSHAARTKRVIGDAVIEDVATFRQTKTGYEGLRFVVRRDEEAKRVYLESSNSRHGKSAASTAKRLGDVLSGKHADAAVLVREEAFPLPPAASKALLEMTPRGALLRLKEGEATPFAAIESLLNAAASRDLPVDRETALDIAVKHLAPSLDLERRIVEAAFPAAASKRTPTSVKTPSLNFDPNAVEEAVAPILAHLRNERAFEPATELVTRLGISIERVHAAMDVLEQRGLVEVVLDRNRSPVVLLRAEGVSP